MPFQILYKNARHASALGFKGVNRIKSENTFEGILKDNGRVKIPQKIIARALELYDMYWTNLSVSIVVFVIWSYEQGKFEEVFQILRAHYDEYLYQIDPELRGLEEADGRLMHYSGEHPTVDVFNRIREMLGIKPESQSTPAEAEVTDNKSAANQ